MTLQSGAHLGPFEILSPLGAGGMGEVYKARDSRLGRTVAIKILPEALAADSQFRERFDREARAISQLTHPHICTLYDVGDQRGTAFLVMEYLEGVTLADRLTKGALPLDQALKTAIEVVSALETAHRAGIVHRDLKPGNIMLTKGGAKLLDFGLAKTGPSVVAGADQSMLPTTPPNLTAQGTILGTFQYMAPEQLEGREADARTDLFSFGAVLYEMLTARKAFEGQTHASLIAAIMHVEPPPVSTLQPISPRALDRVVKKCLAKDADDRWQSARDLRDELEWIIAPGSAAGDANPSVSTTLSGRSSGWRRAVPWTIVVAALACVGLALWAPWRRTASPAIMRLSVELGDDLLLASGVGSSAALSPDGTILAFAAQSAAGGSRQLHVRRLNQLQAMPLSGTDGADGPFFSPDSQWIGFFAGGKLKKIAVTGGAVVPLCDVLDHRGGAWGEDGTIVFSHAGPGVSLKGVSSAGGTPETVTSLAEGEVTHRWPQVLTSGKALLYTSHGISSAFDDANLVVQPLPSGKPKVLQRGGSHGRYLSSGHLVYVSSGTLFAVPFDLERLEVTGQPMPALEGVKADADTGDAQFAVSTTGTLVYVPGRSTSAGARIQWMNQKGETTSLRALPTNWSEARFAPDGSRLAVRIVDAQSVIWVYEWARDTLTRVTADSGVRPVWTPDGRRIAFASRPAGQTASNLYWQRADGTGEAERLTESKNLQLPTSWHPSGKFLAFFERTRGSSGDNDDLMILPMEGDEALGWKAGKPAVFLNSPFSEREPMFSPDGRWLAYSSNESGRFEVYVQPFPGPGSRWQISTGGGNSPVWSRTKRELFYGTTDGQIMVAAFSVDGDTFRPGQSRLWSNGRYLTARSFDLHPDGERIALAAAEQMQAKQDKVVFVFNFFDELRRIAPPTRR